MEASLNNSTEFEVARWHLSREARRGLVGRREMSFPVDGLSSSRKLLGDPAPPMPAVR